MYSVENGYKSLDETEYKSFAQNLRHPKERERLILNFGDAHVIAEFFKQTPYYNIIRNSFPFSDSVCALIVYKILSSTALCFAQNWFDGSYAQILWPNANLSSQRISEVLKTIGEETYWRDFFAAYLGVFTKKQDASPQNQGKKLGILIDSTGLPNDINFPLTAVNNHNDQISEETRLILVVDRSSNMPLYFRYNAGNIVDVSTLKATIDELVEYIFSQKWRLLTRDITLRTT